MGCCYLLLFPRALNKPLDDEPGAEAVPVLFSSFAVTLQGAQLPHTLQGNSQALRKQTASISYLKGNHAWGCFRIWDCRVVHLVNPGTPTGRM